MYNVESETKLGLNNLFDKIKRNLGFLNPGSAYPYRNLVFKGGGVRGIAYMGALEELEEMGVVEGIERVSGSSAGAIAATLVSFRLNMRETMVLFNDLDISQIPQRSVLENFGKIPTLANLGSYKRLIDKYGLYSSEYFYNWISQIIAGKCNGNPRATFKDFVSYGYRDLHIMVSNISRHRPEVFSLHTTPDVAVADAVRISMSIPLYFEALRFNGREFGSGDFYVDGGMYKNYPLDIFDNASLVSDPDNFREGVNWESLGLYLISDRDTSVNIADHPKNLLEFVTLTGRNFYNYHQLNGLKSNHLDEKRTIEISDCGISAVDFSIKPGSEAFASLYESGHKAVQDYFIRSDHRG